MYSVMFTDVVMICPDCCLRLTIFIFFFFLMIRRPPRSTRTDTLFSLHDALPISFQPSLDRDRILTLAQLGFIGRSEVVHFLGPPGTGKSHLATALDRKSTRLNSSH